MDDPLSSLFSYHQRVSKGMRVDRSRMREGEDRFRGEGKGMKQWLRQARWKCQARRKTKMIMCLGKVAQKISHKKCVVFCQDGGEGGHPNQTLFLKKMFFRDHIGPFLGHPKHVLHLDPSPNAIAKAFNVM